MNTKGLTLLREGEPIIPANKGINFESFTVELNCKNSIDDKIIKRITDYGKRLLTKEETSKRFDDYFRDWKREIKREEKERQNNPKIILDNR